MLSIDLDKPLKKGYLLFPAQGVFGHLKKSWHKKYCQLFRASKHGIERLEVFDSEDDANTNLSARIITLENCVKITADAQKLQANVFVVVTKTSTYHFASVDENEMPDWLSAFQSVAFKDESISPSIVEDNELYCSSGEGIFLVKLVRSDASARCGLEPGPYILFLTSSAIQLKDSKDQQLIFTWPYLFIRKYGYRDGKFTFEAGRKCETGEGEFQLEYNNQQEIYRSLSLKMKSMRKLLGGEVLSSPSIFCADTSNQFQVVLGREARSRSPLPPSPTSTSNLLDLDLSPSHTQSVDCIAHHFQPAPPLKPKATSFNNLFHVANESPPIPLKPKPLISPTVETNPLIIINAPAHLQPKNASVTHGSLDKINSRKSPNLFRATLVDIDISNDGPELQPKFAESLAPPLKPKPTKPPRKSLFTSISQKSSNEQDSTNSKRFFRQKSDPKTSVPQPPTSLNLHASKDLVAPYDEVEIRQDAWRTFGIDELTHTERPFSQVKESAESAADYEMLEKAPEETKLKEIQNDKMITAPNINKPKYLPIKPTSVSGDYDTLQHFANTSKSNGKSGYKQVFISHSSPSSPVTPESYSLLESYANQNHTFHDYDEVDDPMEACRPADDSHLGYGMIRKKEATNQNDLRLPKHTMYNNMEYAVITKSKHV